jgi:DnaJ-class molecular chaperone
MTFAKAYAILGIDPTAATPDLVRVSFKMLVLKHHPDHYQDPYLG